MATGNINPLTSDFNFSMVFAFEENFDYTPFLKWMQGNWTLAFWYSALYVILIFGGKYYMQNRPRFEIRPALALWSAILAVFSIFGAIRTVPEIIYVLSKYGWEFSVCSPSYAYYNPTSFWTFMFAISKVYELGDTIFIVLRKQPLIFLHWYHHITTLIYCWYSYAEHIATGRWFIGMNYSIHAFMYTYYAFKAMRFHIPKCVSMAITSLQIMQMVVGTAVNVSAWQVKDSGRYCSASYTNLKFSFLMYFSYMALFCHFFYQVYINNAKASMAQSNTKTYLKPITPKNGFTERNGFPKMNGKNGYHPAAFDKKGQ